MAKRHLGSTYWTYEANRVVSASAGDSFRSNLPLDRKDREAAHRCSINARNYRTETGCPATVVTWSPLADATTMQAIAKAVGAFVNGLFKLEDAVVEDITAGTITNREQIDAAFSE